ncbi:MAG: RDD family protein [Steroidobacteraceae bacterium]
MTLHRFVRPGAWLAGFACLIVLAPSAHCEEPGAMSAPDGIHEPESMHRHGRGHRDQNSVVAIGHDAILAADKRADAVVAILGSASSAGEVADAVVSVLGNTRVTGPVGDSAVAVLGNVYVDSAVNGNVVAVLGDVELGAQAQVNGDVVAVGGVVSRDDAAIVRGSQQSLGVATHVHGIDWLHAWVRHCLLYGRMLAFAPGLGWAWSLALICLALYVLIAALCPHAVERCRHTLETYPLQSLLAALLSILATPVLFVLLCITVIGILALPFVGLALLLADLFGKLVVLAWLGHRVVKLFSPATLLPPYLAVLIGGALALLLYTVPALGMIIYKLLGLLGLGVVVYTLLLHVRAQRAAGRPAPAAAMAGVAPEPVAPSLSPAAPAATAQPAAPGPSPYGESASAAPSTAGGLASAALAYPRAGFWIRMAALLIDVILIGILLSFTWHPGPFGSPSGTRGHLLVLAGYGALMWKLKGATIGGIVFDLQVVRVDGRPLDWATAIVRALSCFLSLFIFGLGFIWIAVDHERQAWHDKIAGTVVVRVPKGVSLV